MDKKIIAHFKKIDPILGSLADKIDLPYTPQESNDLFFDLCDHIISQQLSVKAGNTILGRFVDLFPDKKITPEYLIALSHETMRSVGLSNAKANYVRDLAEKVSHNEVDLQGLHNLSNEDVIEKLVWIKGIGQWTAEMFLMFSLKRPDVFSIGDLGLKNAIKLWYNIDPITKDDMLRISNKWHPYRTYACRILWKSLDLRQF